MEARLSHSWRECAMGPMRRAADMMSALKLTQYNQVSLDVTGIRQEEKRQERRETG